MITENTEHVAEIVELPIEEIVKGKPRMTALLEAVGEQIQALETVGIALYNDRTLDNAEGAQLDVIGRIVGEPRRGKDDEPYRSRLRVRILINRSNGRIPEILRILELFEGWTGTGNAYLRSIGTASMLFTQYAPLVATLAEMRTLLNRVRGGGVNLGWIWSPVVPAQAAVWGWSGSAPEADSARGAAWSGSALTGGKLSYGEVVS